MNYEEKYNKALTAVKKLQEANPNDEGIQSWINDNFPELAESEDERIRKVVIFYFKNYKKQEECGISTFYGIPTDDILAWLEKQSNPKSELLPDEDEIYWLAWVIRRLPDTEKANEAEVVLRELLGKLENMKGGVK